MNKIILLLAFITINCVASAQLKEFECTEKWVQKIEGLAPAHPEVQPLKARKILVFDLFTGFDHWVTPHTSQVIKVLGDKSGAYTTEITKDIYCFEADNLKKYDVVVLNNACSVGPRRDLILDALEKDESLSEKQQKKKAAELEKNLIDYVKKGGGLVVVHGAIVMQNNSMPFSEMVGGSFDYHPPQQQVRLELADAAHPLLKAFNGEAFVHIDEPYLFNKAYEQKNFRPLLYMDTDKLEKKPKPIEGNIRYVSWIKPHGKGRVFYVSPSHNAQSFENPRLLQFFLDGIQYATGDLKCEDQPL
jgi:uncharacterized protein